MNVYSYGKVRSMFSKRGIFILNVYGGNHGLEGKTDFTFKSPKLVKSSNLFKKLSEFINERMTFMFNNRILQLPKDFNEAILAL